jgi:predicted CopG family antitoxin
MVMYMAKTTVTIRDDLYDILRKEAGKRGVSDMINQILAEHLLKERPRTDLFGTMRRVNLSDLRDHAERL